MITFKTDGYCKWNRKSSEDDKENPNGSDVDDNDNIDKKDTNNMEI